MCVQPDLVLVGRLLQHGLRKPRQDLQHRAVYQGQRVPEVFQAWVLGDGLQPSAKFSDDLFETLRLEDLDRFTQRTERRPGTPQGLLDFLQLAGLVDSAQRLDDGVEEEEQDEQAVFIEVQTAVPRLVAVAADLVESLQQGDEFIEELQPLDVAFSDLLSLSVGHAAEYALFRRLAQAYLFYAVYQLSLAQMSCRTGLLLIPFPSGL
jgi:hypothetical protein